MSEQLASVTQDFIFGTLATDDLRLEALRRAGRGLTHANRLDPPDPQPDQPVRLTASAGTEVDARQVSALVTTDGGEPAEEATRFDFSPGDVVWDTLLWGYRREWRATIPPQPAGTLVRYRIAARTAGGETIWAEPDPITGRPATFAYHVDRERVPAWAYHAVIYHVFVDRFAPGAGRAWRQTDDLAGFVGGTIPGVTEALPYLARLGVTCLWLSPVFPSPTHHGYDATDYLAVEPRLGTTEDVVALFGAAHAHGMRVLLDFVPNHVSSEHPAFRRATTDPAAPERDWFTFRRWPDDYRSFFGVRSMPQLDTDSPGASGYLIDAATHWLRLGADGCRLDYANGPSHAFWARFRAAIRAAKPGSLTVGEVVETAELQRSYQGRLDGTLDFLLQQQLRAFFAFETTTAAELDAFLGRHLAYFPADFVLPSFLDNHDMNRFLWVARGDKRRLKLAALCQFTLPHPPIVYYGTEVGLSQRRDLEYPDGSRRMEESRTPMPWGDDQDLHLLRFYTNLIALRRAHPDLWRGERTAMVAEGGLYAVAIARAGRTALVALNRTGTAQQVAVPGGLSLALATGDVTVGPNGAVRLAPLAGAVLLGAEPVSR